MTTDFSSYPPPFILKVAKELKNKQFDFTPYYESDFERNLDVAKGVGGVFGINIPVDFYYGLYQLNKEKNIFENNFNSKQLRYPEKQMWACGLKVNITKDIETYYAHYLESYAVLSSHVEEIFRLKLSDGDIFWDEGLKIRTDDRNEELINYDVENAQVVDAATIKKNLKLESLSKDQLLRIKKIINE